MSKSCSTRFTGCSDSSSSSWMSGWRCAKRGSSGAITRRPICVREWMRSRPSGSSFELRAASSASRHRLQHQLGMPEEGLPGLGDLEVAAGAVDQLHAQLFLQRADAARDGGRRKAEAARRGREAALPLGGHEDPQRVECLHFRNRKEAVRSVANRTGTPFLSSPARNQAHKEPRHGFRNLHPDAAAKQAQDLLPDPARRRGADARGRRTGLRRAHGTPSTTSATTACAPRR